MNRIALITGASRGLGKDMALRLAQTGCDTIITYQSKEVEAGEVVAQIKQMGQKATALQFDVGEIKSFDGFVEKLQATLKQDFETDKLDILINNARLKDPRRRAGQPHISCHESSCQHRIIYF